MATQSTKRTLNRSMNLEQSGETSGSPLLGEVADLPLSSDMRRQIYELKAAYEDFWQQRKFRKGWAKPLFAFDEAVEELLARAAEVVVRTRSHIDQLNRGGDKPGLSKSASAITTRRLPRFKEGRAREYLCNLEQDPRAAPQQFVREMVHATLSSEDGYLEEGLTSDKLDHYIDQITSYMRQRDEQEARATVQLEEKLKRRWAKAEKLLQAFYALDVNEKASKTHYQSLQKIIKRVDDVSEELKRMQRQREAIQQAQRQTDVEVEAESKKPEEASASEEVAPAEGQLAEREESEEVPVAVAVERPAEEKAANIEGKEEDAQTPQQTEIALEEEKHDQPKEERTEEEVGEVALAEEKEETTTEQAASPVAQENAAQGEEQADTTEPPAAPVAEEGREQKEGEEKEKDEESEQKRLIEEERQKAMLKIKNVADSVTRLSDQIEGFASEATGLDMEELQKEPESAEKTLSKLQKQCLFYSENLMKDLLSLDAISTGTLPGSEEASEEVRPLRKQQVKEIQGLLQDVDQVNSKLKAMLKKVQEEKQRKEEQRKKLEMDERANKPQQAEEAQPSAAEKDRARSEGGDQSVAAAQGSKQQPGSPGKGAEMWRSLKLKPKFEMARTPDSIILQAHIPGMREEDIEIERDDDQQSFTVKGLRVPTPAEEAAMRRQLKSMMARDPWGLYYPQGEKERDLLMRMGAGRYGSFSETFEVSREMDLLGISASYAGGVLRIVVPIHSHQKQQQQRPKAKPAQPYGQTRYGGGAPQRRRNSQPQFGYPAGPQGFFDDKSFWW